MDQPVGVRARLIAHSSTQAAADVCLSCVRAHFLARISQSPCSERQLTMPRPASLLHLSRVRRPGVFAARILQAGALRQEQLD
jgi:hypothetical protein